MHPLRFSGLVIIVLIMTALTPFSPIGTPSVRIAHATTRTVSLVGHYSTGWNNTNPTITITQGDTLVITTSSGDGFQHHFFVDIDGLGMTPNCSVDKCASIIPPTATDSLTGFTMGTYSYYCQYHAAMKGTFIVQPPPPDFSISLDQTSLNIAVGSSGNATVTLASQNGFAGAVNLAATISPSGPTASLTPAMVSLTSGGSATSKLTITTSSGLYSSTSPGSYTVTVTGSGSPSLSHPASLSIIVTSPSLPAQGIPASTLIIAGVAVLAAIIVVAVVVLRRRPRK